MAKGDRPRRMKGGQRLLLMADIGIITIVQRLAVKKSPDIIAAKSPFYRNRRSFNVKREASRQPTKVRPRCTTSFNIGRSIMAGA